MVARDREASALVLNLKLFQDLRAFQNLITADLRVGPPWDRYETAVAARIKDSAYIYGSSEHSRTVIVENAVVGLLERKWGVSCKMQS